MNNYEDEYPPGAYLIDGTPMSDCCDEIIVNGSCSECNADFKDDLATSQEIRDKL